MEDWYGDRKDYIHLKFGDARKAYNFTDKFRKEHPTFCAEYEKYWLGDVTCKFEDPLQIVNYVEMWNIPVGFYFNFTDTPAKNIAEVKEYLLSERVPRESGKYENSVYTGWDGEKQSEGGV